MKNGKPTIGQLHIGDYIQTEAGKGYIRKLYRKEKELLVELDYLADIPAKISVKLVEKIIRAKRLFRLNYYYYDSDTVNTYTFNTRKEALAYIDNSKETAEASDYTLALVDRDTWEILEDIII